MRATTSGIDAVVYIIATAVEYTALVVVVVDGVEEIVKFVVAELFFKVLGESLTDELDGLVVVEVLFVEFVVLHGVWFCV